MFQCIYIATGEPAPKGEIHYRCTNKKCGHERTSRHDPYLLHHDCVESAPAGPRVLVHLSRYARAVKRWTEAGKPTRTDEQVATIFAICQACEHFAEARSKCRLCGCRLNIGKNARFNKIRMATESCPDSPARW